MKSTSSKFVSILLLFLIFIGLSRLSSFAPSKVNIDGRTLSNAEVLEGDREMGVLMRYVKVDGVNSLNLSYEPRTVIGKKVKGILSQFTDSRGRPRYGG